MCQTNFCNYVNIEEAKIKKNMFEHSCILWEGTLNIKAKY